MNLELTPLLSNIGNLSLNKFQIDTKNDRIKLNFNKQPNQVSEIIFDEVTSFYYLDHDNENDTGKNKLNNIMYCNNTIDFFEEDEEAQISVPNFILELNDSNVFIEANSIVIDEKKYKV